ncbi:UTP--glucose-1-phosphate uridylyltransferase [Thermococcus sp.]
MKAIIPAAGLGTRMLPLTKAQPKEMLPVVRKPTIQYIIEEAYEAEIREILIITGKHKRAIEDHFDRYEHDVKNRELEKLDKILEEMDIYYVRQKKPRGLGDALLHARAFVQDEPFALLLGDTITKPACIKETIEMHEKTGKSVVSLEKVPLEKVSLYGIVKIENGRITQLVEKPSPEKAPSTWAILGRYVLTPEVFEYLKKVKPDKKGEIQLTDALQLMVEDGIEVVPHLFMGRRYDIGNFLDWLRANVELALEDPTLGEDFRKIIKEALGNVRRR